MRDIDNANEDPIRLGYERNAEYWTKIVREGHDPYQKNITDPALLDAIGDPSGLDFLDAGCGEGFLARELVVRGAHHVYGVDVSQALVDAARTHAAADTATSTFTHGDVANLPFPDNYIDVVIANRLPHALADPGQRFTEFARVLRPHGRFIYLSLHPCFYVARDRRAETAPASGRPAVTAEEYFSGRTIVQKFNVGGLVSPAPSVQRFYSLETHCRLITRAGFVITDIAEPRPQSHGSDDEGSGAAAFPIPLFLMLSCTISR